MSEKISSKCDAINDMASKSAKHVKSSRGCGCRAKAPKSAEAVRASLRDNPGSAIDRADCDKVDAHLVKEDTGMLNNNPRNNDL